MLWHVMYGTGSSNETIKGSTSFLDGVKTQGARGFTQSQKQVQSQLGNTKPAEYFWSKIFLCS